MAEASVHLDTSPRPVTTASADRLAGLMPKLVSSLGIHVEKELGDNTHFWYLVGRNYSTQKRRIPRSLPEMARVENKQSVRSLAIQNAIEQSKERFFLEGEAATDKLTGAFNRRSLDAYLENIVLHRRAGFGDVFVMLDIDDFKQINDRFGHLVGDGALKSLVSIIDSKKRGVDFLARYGGEEFAIVMPGVEMTEGWRETMHARVEEFRSIIQKELQERLETLSGIKLDKDLTASFGVTFINGTGGRPTLESVYAASDKYLYEAKHAGKNKVVSEISHGVHT